ncbi:MAG: antibiotic biosynthesis monooxygenase [Opitutaceae bacterium]
MIVVHVHVQVKPECVEAFRTATIENARNSIQEPGIARFDVVQLTEDPTRFLLVEAYRDAGAQDRHRQTGHYQTWRTTVESMMATPRSATRYTSVFPEESGW